MTSTPPIAMTFVQAAHLLAAHLTEYGLLEPVAVTLGELRTWVAIVPHPLTNGEGVTR
jgi:hypothetical protein